MDFETYKIPGLVIIKPKMFGDSRGFFMETYRSSLFCENIGRDVTFVQDNHSFSKNKGTLRGLHFQSPPKAQGKLVRCTRGELLDVAVDARVGSPTYGQHASLKLSADNGLQLWVPEGFLHGFVTLTDNCEIMYKCTDYYSAEHDGSVFWKDSTLDIDWKADPDTMTISDKDRNAVKFSDWASPFTYNPT